MVSVQFGVAPARIIYRGFFWDAVFGGTLRHGEDAPLCAILVRSAAKVPLDMKSWLRREGPAGFAIVCPYGSRNGSNELVLYIFGIIYISWCVRL